MLFCEQEVSNSLLISFFLASKMLWSIEKEGLAEEGQEIIFFKKGGIEWQGQPIAST